MKKKKITALLTIVVMILNMFSPYTALIVNAAADTVEDDALTLYNYGVVKSTSYGDVIRVQMGISTADINFSGIDFRLKIDTSKIRPCHMTTGKPLTIAAAPDGVELTKFQGKENDYYLGSVGAKTYVIDPDSDGSNTGLIYVVAADAGGTELLDNANGSYGPGETFDDDSYDLPASEMPDRGYYPIIDLYFLVDSSVDGDNLPTDAFGLYPAPPSAPTGCEMAYYRTDGIEVVKDFNSINCIGKFVASAKTITGIAVKTNPTNTTYEHGDTIDLTGGAITVTYSDGTTEDVNMTDAGVSITSPTGGKADVGNQTVTISYEGKTTTFNTTVTDPVQYLDTVGGMSTTTYNHGDTINFSGLSLQATRKSGATVPLNLTDNGVTTSETIASVNSSNFTQNGTTSGGLVTGQQKIKFTYTEPGTSNTVSTTSSGSNTEASIIVNDTVTAVNVTSQPTKVTYKRGESLSLSGAKVQLTLASGNTPIEISLPNASVTVGTYSPTTTGSKQNLSVAYGSVTSTDTINVEAYNYITNATLTLPSDVNPEYNTNLNLAGGKFNFTWQDGTTSNVNLTDSSVIISGYSSTTLTAQTVTATYTTNYTLSDGTQIPETITKTFTVQVDDKVNSIAIIAPTKTSYNHGDSLDLTGGKITVTTKSGATRDVPMDTSMITDNGGTVNMSPSASEYTNNNISKTLTITYTEDGVTQTTNYPITINNNVTGIAMGTTPTKTQYNLNETTYNLANPAGTNGYGDIVVTRAAGNTETVALNATGVTLTNLSTLTTTGGSKTVTVSYEGQTTSFNITVVNGITGITITTPTKTDFEHGDSLDLTGGKIEVTYADGTTATPSMTTAMITETTSGSSVNMSPADSEYNSNNEVTKNLTITYTEDGQTQTATYNIKITNPVDTIAIATSPTTSYNLNDSTANAGGTLTVTRKSGKIETVNITDSMISGLNTTTAGSNKNATVTYEGKTVTYTYTVIDNVASIAITAPTDTNFNHGDALTVNGGIITVTYASGTTSTPTMTTAMITEKTTGTAVNMSPAVSDYTSNQVTKTLTITYTENGVTQTKDYTITINNNVTGIAMGTTPTKTQYNLNETTYNLANPAGTNGYGDIVVTRAAGNTETVALNATGVTLTNLSTLTTTGGSKTVTVSYEGQTTSFNITVVNGITGITITTPTKTDFEHGDSLDLTGGKIEVTYADGTTATPSMTTAMITETTSGTSVNMSPNASEYSNNSLTKNLTITYTEGTKTETINYNITIYNSVDHIAMNQTPKDSYKYGETTDITTGTIDVYRKANPTVVSDTINLTDSAVTVTGLDTTTAGTGKTATVTYEETYGTIGKIQKVTTYNYSVSDKVTGMIISGNPKTNYEYGDTIDLSGITIRITTESNPTGTLITLPNSNIKVDGFDTTSEGTKTVTLKYLDDNGNPVNDLNGNPIEYQFTINVKDPITSIAMDSSAMPKQNY